MNACDIAVGASIYRLPIPDANAVHFTPEHFSVHADGVGDDAPALQAAIDRAYVPRVGGIVLIPEGRYRLGATVHIWRGVRLIGYGASRPVFVLGANTPGYQEGNEQYLFHFCHMPQEPGQPLQDANNSTFFSGISNCNIVIEEGNPAAVAVRFFVAQHSSLEHIDFHLGTARAGVERIGNEIEDCRFFGGQWAILAQRTSPCWQALLLDCTFEGQLQGAIHTEHAGLTVVRGQFRNTPAGIVSPLGRPEQPYLKDSLFENVDTVMSLGEGNSPENQVNIENVTCAGVQTFLQFADREERYAPEAPCYRVTHLCHGLHIAEGKREHAGVFTWEPLAALPAMPPRDYPALPPMASWINVRDLGAKGDMQTDDTAAFRQAFAAGRPVYVPMGWYRISDTLEMAPDTVLIGLHPAATQFTLANETPGFTDASAPRAMLVAPQGGRNLVTGLGFNPTMNPGAMSIHWMAGAESCLDDVYQITGRMMPEWRSKFANVSIRVSKGGGGCFKNIWSANMQATVGLVVEDTTTSGRIYLMSVEHHLHNEVMLRNVRHWRIYALQTEENTGSERSLAVQVTDCRDLLFANLFMYRVMRIADRYPQAMQVRGSQDITIRGLHVFSWGPFAYDNGLLLEDTATLVPEHEAAWVAI